MKKTILIILVIVLLGVAGGSAYVLLNHKSSKPSTPQEPIIEVSNLEQLDKLTTEMFAKYHRTNPPYFDSIYSINTLTENELLVIAHSNQMLQSDDNTIVDCDLYYEIKLSYTTKGNFNKILFDAETTVISVKEVSKHTVDIDDKTVTNFCNTSAGETLVYVNTNSSNGYEGGIIYTYTNPINIYTNDGTCVMYNLVITSTARLNNDTLKEAVISIMTTGAQENATYELVLVAESPYTVQDGIYIV